GDKIPEESLGLKFNSHWADRHPVGVGPYKFKKFKKGSRIVLEKFDAYWGKEPPIDKIVWRIVKKAQPAYLQLKAD
ncbi:MAG: ABC transporter substrate-binding protein, partial [Bradymonadaceae bacterium]